MGVDLYLRETPCETCGHQREDFEINYTYNAAPMWYRIYPDDHHMVDIDGMTGEEAYPKLVFAREFMEKNKDELKNLEPPNGWGSYQGFYDFITKCIQACIDNPKLIWEAWR